MFLRILFGIFLLVNLIKLWKSLYPIVYGLLPWEACPLSCLSVFFYTVENGVKSIEAVICTYCTHMHPVVYYNLNIYWYTGENSFFKMYFLVCLLFLDDVELSFTTSALFIVDFSVWYIETGEVSCWFGVVMDSYTLCLFSLPVFTVLESCYMSVMSKVEDQLLAKVQAGKIDGQ